MTDATGTSEWVFNVVGQVTSLTTPQGSFSYTYNTWGQPLTMTDSSGVWTTVYNDVTHRATGMTNPWSETTSVTFDSAGRVNRKDLPNGMYETYHFDDRSRVEEVKTYNSSNVWQDTKAYVWDAASRITTATEGGVATTYGYDDIDQLLSESRSGYSASYTYDANGNRLTRTVGGTTETYHYDDADKLTYISVGQTTTKSYSYDDAGRTTSMTTSAGTTSFTYDYDGKVTGISYPGSVSDSFGYNGLGARVSTSGTNGSRTFRRAGIGVTSSVLDDGTKKYTPGVSSRQGSTSTFQHSGLKNATEQSNSSQSVTATKKYDAFGNTVSSSGTWQGPFGYAGSFGYQEDPNGLKLLGHRYYDSGTGRFMSSDPAGHGRNWYAYCGNNPIGSADPSGLRRIPPPRGPGMGPPPPGIPAPAGGWMWVKSPKGSGRPGKWVPRNPIAGGPNPSVSWDPEGHWDRKDGLGNTDRYTKVGKPITPEYAHGRNAWHYSRGWGRYAKYGGKVLKVLILITLVAEGPDAAARDLAFADEVEYVGGQITQRVEPALDNAQGAFANEYYGRAGITESEMWGVDDD